MKVGAPASFGGRLKALREAAGFTQEELATIAGLSVHAVSALERGERRRPHLETVRALSAALDLTGETRDALLGSARTPAADCAPGDTAGFSLPRPLTPLLGRDGDLQTLRQWIADPDARLITIMGPGGVGKTRLALELARALADEDAKRVVFVPLAAIRDASLVAPAIAEALGLSDVAAVDLPRRAKVACDDHTRLLVLDNCEQVLDAAPLLAELLASTASLRLLATSRAALRVRGEREYALGPLALEAGSESMSPADLARCPAVRLFVDRVRGAQPGFRLTSANGPTVTAICRRLDALPLALELAAPWIKVLTVEDLLRRLAGDVLLSTAGPRDLPERQQTMNATVAWSYQLLGPGEQRAFRRFGALPGRFPIEAAAAVLAGSSASLAGGAGSDTALGAAASLIDKSLLQRAEAPTSVRPLFQMLETVRAYATLELASANERDDAMEGLARYCRDEASVAETELVGLAQVEWLHRVRTDLESYRGALTWLVERGRSTEASDIACGLKFYWLIRGRAAEGLGWYERILRLPSLPPADECRLLAGAALMSYTKGQLPQTIEALERSIALATGIGDLYTAAQAETLYGHVERAMAKPDRAHERLMRSLEAFRALSVPWGIGSALNGLAGLALAKGEDADAERLLSEATSVSRLAGPWFLMPILYVRAIRAVRQGDADEAIALLRENLDRMRELHDRFAFVYALIPLATAASLKGDDARAARILGARDAVIERTGLSVVDTPVHDLRDRTERIAREHLGADRWDRAFAAGRMLSIDSAQDLYRFVTEGRR
jgi:predicted ATPase/DNA-binding XRE family transcriptional regulator